MNFKSIRVILIVSLLVFGGCKIYAPLEVGNPEDLQLNSISPHSLELTLHLPIRNPNVYRIKVTKLEGIASINDQKAGKIQSSENIKVPANSNKIHEVPLKVDYSDLISAGLDVSKFLREGKVNLAIKGTLTARSFLYRKEIHFNKQRTLNLHR